VTDLRLQRMAQVLIRYSLGIKPGERLGIRTQPSAAPLVREVVREAIHAGAHPEVFIDVPGVKEIILKQGSDAQLAYIPDATRLIAEEYEAALDILSQENTKDSSGIDPARIALQNQARRDILRTAWTRFNDGTLHRSIAVYPTNAYAQDANMSLSEFEEFLFHACFLDDDDPIACWRELSRRQERLIQWLSGRHIVHIVGKDTDLTLSIGGRTFLNDDARGNFPGGEFFTGPVENSANGYIRYSFPASYGGRSVGEVRLCFEEGVVVEARASQGQEYLEKMLSLDEGACRIGEFAFGNNPNIDHCTGNVLFDEKMSGTIHLALGAGFPATGATNQSILHWDMVHDLHAGSEIRVDGELFCKDGSFVI
jgi:aminopeptidase